MANADSMLETVERLQEKGYDASMRAVDDGLECSSCSQTVPSSEFGFEELRRVEGTSDPDDMVAVVAGHCPRCGAGVTAALHYGALAYPEEAEALSAMIDLRENPTP